MKRLLIPNGNYTDIPLIIELKKLGYYIISSGNNPKLLGHSYTDEYICADYSDKELMLKIAKRLQIDAIAANANDFGVITAAYIAEQLGLSGHDTYENATIIHEKDRFRNFAMQNDLLTPKAFTFNNIEKAKEYISSEMKFPLIIKPVDLTGGKGVSRVDSLEESFQSIENAFSRSKAKRIVIEEFIEGTQHSITSFLVNNSTFPPQKW